jgi:hypothetical protein
MGQVEQESLSSKHFRQLPLHLIKLQLALFGLGVKVVPGNAVFADLGRAAHLAFVNSALLACPTLRVEKVAVRADIAFIRAAVVAILRTGLAELADVEISDFAAQTGQRVGPGRAIVAVSNSLFAGSALAILQIEVAFAEHAVSCIVQAEAVIDHDVLACVCLFLEHESGLAEVALFGLFVAIEAISWAFLALSAHDSVARFADIAGQKTGIFDLVISVSAV